MAATRRRCCLRRPNPARTFPCRRSTLETLEPRQLLSADGLGIQLLPAGFDPADYAEIGPQRIPDRTDAHTEIAAKPIGGFEQFTSDAELANYLVELAVRRYAENFGKTVDGFPPFGFAAISVCASVRAGIR